ncbi:MULTISPECIES: hypothetical protein [unclassified Brevibacterium]|uniref:hypothetical protein n=1 Tax=unclassified Brevibacterium TaxID=2614124 RepID=UPI001081CFC8|nr:hypothetical protein [Brevibacterium sp. S111]TGD08923.1 hypothetical protein EB836_16150 [Brevibacterium sp. S111]
MYTLLNNQESSKYDLYLPGQLVAALHYKLERDANEVMFIYCEAIESTQADRHRRELMRRAVEDVKGRRLKLIITCPIARKTLEQADAPAHVEKPQKDTPHT